MVWVGLGFGLVKKNGLSWFGLLNLAETHTSSVQYVARGSFTIKLFNRDDRGGL